MPEPFDHAVTLQTVLKISQQTYFNKLLEQMTLSGKATNGLFSLADDPVLGDGKNYKFKRFMADSFRPNQDALSGFGTPRPFKVEEIKVRFNERDQTVNDFVKLAGAGRVSEYQLLKAEDSGDAAIIDIVQTLEQDFTSDFEFKYACMRNLDRTCRMGVVTADIVVQDDRPYYADCSPAGGGGNQNIRLKISNGAIGWFREGLIVNIYTAAGVLHADNVQLTSPPNSSDGSIGFALTTDSTVANLDSVTTGDEIFWSGARNQGMWSIEAWMSMPTSTDSFMAGVNRSTAQYRALVPLIQRNGAANAKLAKSMFDDAADALATKFDKPEIGTIVRMQQNLQTGLRSQYDEAAFIQWPSTDDAGKRFANLGSSGINYRHPALGLLSFQADPFMQPGVVDMLVLDDWMALYYKRKGLRVMPGAIGGSWDRMESAVPGEGKTMFYQMQAYANVADFCKFPQRQVRIKGVTAS